MPDEDNAAELYRRYRPSTFKEVVGQSEAIACLNSMGKSGKIPHFLLLTGGSGVGKTSLARILVKKLKCGQADFKEINAAQDRGIDMVRGIEPSLGLSPMDGDCKIWLVDEAGLLTSEAQSAFLKILEDTDSWNYFIFCTTDPQKLKSTIKTRATIIELKAVGRKDMIDLLSRVYQTEKKGTKISQDVADKIVDIAEGSPRKALVLLGQIINIEGDDAQFDVLIKAAPSHQAIELAQALSKKASWAEVAKILNGIEGLDEQAESIRWLVMSYMSKFTLNSRGSRAAWGCHVIDCFSDSYFQTKKAGLISSCHAAVSSKL